jgi:hypothetical protein
MLCGHSLTNITAALPAPVPPRKTPKRPRINLIRGLLARLETFDPEFTDDPAEDDPSHVAQGHCALSAVKHIDSLDRH